MCKVPIPVLVPVLGAIARYIITPHLDPDTVERPSFLYCVNRMGHCCMESMLIVMIFLSTAILYRYVRLFSFPFSSPPSSTVVLLNN